MSEMRGKALDAVSRVIRTVVVHDEDVRVGESDPHPSQGVCDRTAQRRGRYDDEGELPEVRRTVGLL